MTKRVVIAEKPSVGMSIAAVLGVKDRKEGYLEGRDTIVSWGFGHLAELANADAYDEKYAKWNHRDLPIIPADWKYKIPRDKYSQFAVLKKLMNREDVSEVINACDAGREGELIFRNIYKMTGCSKPIRRLWISSMEDTAIQQGFRELKEGKEYDNLFAAARCREWADWLVGINATRLFSVLYHRTLNVGRVVSPTLAILVQREAEIDAFQPKPFYTAVLDFGSFTAESEKYPNKADAAAIMPMPGADAIVQSVTFKEKGEKAPALYDLTTLQREANRKRGFTAQQTLDYVQSLYEKKLCTYPRTDSRYLTNDMLDGVEVIVDCAAGICGEEKPVTVHAKQVCNGKKVSDHHAIIPTTVAGKTDLGTLPAGEREVLMMIAKQVLRAVSGACKFCETTAELENYELVYTGQLPDAGSQIETLESLYRTFNIDHPADFTGHSLSVSDIVALRQNGVLSCHYVDRIGYREFPHFIESENYLKTAEMLLEDDYGMIDGVINNGPKEPVQQPEKPRDTKTRKTSVLEKLRRYQAEDRKEAAMHRSAERDL